jgi:hypothetical protein
MRTDRDRARHRFYVEHVAGPSVGSRGTEPQPATLADGEAVRPVVLADGRARGVDQPAGLLAERAPQVPTGVTVGDEADVVAVRLLRDRESTVGSLGADVGLLGVAEREQGVGELVGTQHRQHVRLVLGTVDGTVQLGTSDAVDTARVVPGRHRVEPQRERPVEHGRELDPLVAAHARVGRAPGGVLGDEVVNDVGLEPLAHVPDVERHVEDVCGALRVAGVLARAAAPAAGPQGRRGAGQGKVHAGDVMAGIDGPGRRHRGVDATGHGRKHAHGQRLAAASPAARARSTTGTIASTNASTSSAVEV